MRESYDFSDENIGGMSDDEIGSRFPEEFATDLKIKLAKQLTAMRAVFRSSGQIDNDENAVYAEGEMQDGTLIRIEARRSKEYQTPLEIARAIKERLKNAQGKNPEILAALDQSGDRAGGISSGPSESPKIIGMLRTKAEKFSELMVQAEAALERKDTEEQRRLLIFRAQIIIDLPETLAEEMQAIEGTDLQEEIAPIRSWVRQAQQALDSADNYLLSMLLIPSNYSLDKGDNFMRFVTLLESKY
jgi:hypothetical protein